MKSELLYWYDDGLPMISTGPWAETKYRALWNYISMFSTGMKRIFERRLYIDLYSGVGAVQIDSSMKIFKGSPLLALSVRDPFDSYMFCEENPNSISSLKQRISKNFPEKSVNYIYGDCNEKVDEMVGKIRRFSDNKKTLSFCFVDPFSLDLRFDTIKAVALAGRVDFLVLLALMMDANRNETHYVREDSKKVENFLSDSNWREDWKKFSTKDTSFPRFLAKQFEKQMLSLGYLKSEKENTMGYIACY